MSILWQRKWQEVLAQCTCTFVLLYLNYCTCTVEKDGGREDPLRWQQGTQSTFYNNLFTFTSSILAFTFSFYGFFHQWVKFKKKYRHFSWGYGCPQNNHGAFTYCPNFFPPLSSHSRPARNFWSKRLIFDPSVHIMDGKMAMAETMYGKGQTTLVYVVGFCMCDRNR